MSTKALAAKMDESPRGLKGLTAASRGYGSDPIREADFSQLTPKEQGEWYLPIVLVGWWGGTRW